MMEPVTIIKHGENPKNLKSRGIILILFFLIATFNSYSQKISGGSFAFLEGQEFFNVVLDFEFAELQRKPENEYLETVSPAWVKRYEEAKKTIFLQKFVEHLNKNLKSIKGGDYPDAEYQAEIRVLSIKRAGYGDYLDGSGVRYVKCEIFFIRKSDSQQLARITNLNGDSNTKTKFSLIDSPPDIQYDMVREDFNNYLIGIAFGNIGHDFGKFIKKQLKKIQ